MDFKKFGRFIILLGILVVGYGVVSIAQNQPVKARRSTNPNTLRALTENMGGFLDTMEQNEQRKINRQKAVKFIVGGGIISIFGIGLYISAKPSFTQAEPRE